MGRGGAVRPLYLIVGAFCWLVCRTLKWRSIYLYPTVVFPVVATIIHTVFVFKFNSVHPSDDLHCDSTHPEWWKYSCIIQYLNHLLWFVDWQGSFLELRRRPVYTRLTSSILLHKIRLSRIQNAPASPTITLRQRGILATWKAPPKDKLSKPIQCHINDESRRLPSSRTDRTGSYISTIPSSV